MNGGQDEYEVQEKVIKDLIQEVDGVKGEEITFEAFKMMMLRVVDRDENQIRT